jgi:hypothetical protein
MTEHEKKYGKLAKALGWDDVKALIPATIEEVKAALAAGDEHLNSIPLTRWDHAALGASRLLGKKEICPCCKQTVRIMPPRHGCGGKLKELFDRIKQGHSLSDGVCVLKHVAKVEAMK